MQPIDPQSLRQDMSAFCDGELDTARTGRLLRHLVDDPLAMAELQRLQLLTGAARRLVIRTTPPPSADLLDRLRELSDIADQRISKSARPSMLPWMLLMRAAAAVLLLAVGIEVGRWTLRPPASSAPPNSSQINADVVPASLVSQAEEIHGVCSRLAAGLHSAGYPSNIAALAATVEQDLHSDHPYPDLSAIGFRYRGAGPCGKPMADTAHLLYQSVRPGSISAVSVFVQPWRGQYPLATGRIYTVSVAQNGFPMLAWRTERVVYFLLADGESTEQAALRLIQSAPARKP